MSGFGGTVRLNVGGIEHHTSIETLRSCPGSFLEAFVSGRFETTKDNEGRLFIDRDGTRFRHVINWLRSGTVPAFESLSLYDEIIEEADFYGLDPLKELCEAQKAEALEEQQVSPNDVPPSQTGI